MKLGPLSMRRNPTLSALMVAAIATGIGACMTIVNIEYVMSGNPIPHRSDRVVQPGDADQLPFMVDSRSTTADFFAMFDTPFLYGGAGMAPRTTGRNRLSSSTGKSTNGCLAEKIPWAVRFS